MKRSRLLFAGAILGTAYLAYLAAVGVTLLGGASVLPENAYIFGHPIDFRYLALHALSFALATLLAWIAFAAKSGALAALSLILCAVSGASAPLLAGFAAPQAALLIAGFVGLRRNKRERRKRAAGPDPAAAEAATPPAPPADVRKDEPAEKENHTDLITVVMTSLCLLVVAAVICVVLYGLSQPRPAPADAADYSDGYDDGDITPDGEETPPDDEDEGQPPGDEEEEAPPDDDEEASPDDEGGEAPPIDDEQEVADNAPREVFGALSGLKTP